MVRLTGSPRQGKVLTAHLPGGGARPIINLRALNEFVEQQKEGWRTVRALIIKGDFLIRLDLKDASLSVSIHPDDRPWLGFRRKDQCFQWNVLPFGLKSAPWVFPKRIKPVVVFLRKQDMCIVILLDDLLLLDWWATRAATMAQSAREVLQNLGFVINLEKSLPRTVPVRDLPGLHYREDRP